MKHLAFDLRRFRTRAFAAYHKRFLLGQSGRAGRDDEFAVIEMWLNEHSSRRRPAEGNPLLIRVREFGGPPISDSEGANYYKTGWAAQKATGNVIRLSPDTYLVSWLDSVLHSFVRDRLVFSKQFVEEKDLSLLAGLSAKYWRNSNKPPAAEVAVDLFEAKRISARYPSLGQKLAASQDATSRSEKIGGGQIDFP